MLSLIDDNRVQVFGFGICASNKHGTLELCFDALSALEGLQRRRGEACQFPAHSGRRAVSTVTQNPAISWQADVNVFPGRFPILLKKIIYRGQSVRLGVDTMSHTQRGYDFVRKAGKSRYDTKRAF
jgi:hypothetical protein